jgi:ribonuclease E
VVEAAPQETVEEAPQVEAAAEPQTAATPVEAAQLAPAAPQPARSSLSAEALKPVLESAGLVWVNTDISKLRAAQEAAAQAVKPARVPRERKALPPVDSAPMQQVETAKHPQ